MFLALLLSIAPIVPSGTEFTCSPVAVWDGDGPIWCEEGPRVRLAGVAARELDESCREYHPCPTATGAEARDFLVETFGGSEGRLEHGHIVVDAAPMTCLSDGEAGGNRTAAWCRLNDGRDLNCLVVETGVALAWPRYWRDHRCD